LILALLIYLKKTLISLRIILKILINIFIYIRYNYIEFGIPYKIFKIIYKIINFIGIRQVGV